MNFWTRPAQEETALPDTGHGPIQLRRNARARRITLRVSQLDGKVTVTAPTRTPMAEIRAFLSAHEGWLDNAVGKVLAPVTVDAAVEIPFKGHSHRIEFVQGGRSGATIASSGVITIGGRAERIGTRVAAFLKEAARAELARQIPELAYEIGHTAGKLTLRDTRSRWGSCTQSGDLMFSWRLIMAPPEVLRYVAAHEVAHLRHMDHSAAFWATVEDLMPDYKGPRKWLRDHGRELHRYDFK